MQFSTYVHDPAYWSDALPSGVPFLVPPAINKSEHHRAIRPVWAQAAKELSEAKSIFVIGYSFPDADIFFKHLFAIGTVGPDPLRHIEVYDPNADKLKKRFGTILGSAGARVFRVWDLRFIDAISTIETRFKYKK
jgi:hypothetical protein